MEPQAVNYCTNRGFIIFILHFRRIWGVDHLISRVQPFSTLQDTCCYFSLVFSILGATIGPFILELLLSVLCAVVHAYEGRCSDTIRLRYFAGARMGHSLFGRPLWLWFCVLPHFSLFGAENVLAKDGAVNGWSVGRVGSGLRLGKDFRFSLCSWKPLTGSCSRIYGHFDDLFPCIRPTLELWTFSRVFVDPVLIL